MSNSNSDRNVILSRISRDAQAEAISVSDVPDQLTQQEEISTDQEKLRQKVDNCKRVSGLTAKEKDELRNNDIRELLYEQIANFKSQITDLKNDKLDLQNDKQNERDFRRESEFKANALAEKLTDHDSLKISHSRLLTSQIVFGVLMALATALAFASENYDKIDALKTSTIFPQVTFWLSISSAVFGILLQGFFSFIFRK